MLSGSPILVTNLHDHGDGSCAAITAADANPGSTIDFANGLHGTITLTSGELDITGDMTINGPGANKLTVSGNNTSRIFDIGNGATATISGLTIANGASVNTGEDSSGNLVDATALGGGGILNQAGATLNLTNSVLANNTATASSNEVDVFGGGLLNEGTATITSSLFRGNQAVGGGGISAFGGSIGGGIDNFGGASLTVTNSTFASNQAISADGTTWGIGGAIENDAGLDGSHASVANITHCTFSNNVATGGQGAVGQGGALASYYGATMTVGDSTFLHNQAIGGSGADGVTNVGQGEGGGIFNAVSTLTVNNSTFIGNEAIGGSGGSNTAPGSSEGVGGGGGIANFVLSTAIVTGCTFLGNQAIGGDSAEGPGGIGQGGGILNNAATLTLSGSSFLANTARGGSGASGYSGGAGVGGALDNYAAFGGTTLDTVATITGTTFLFNQALGGAGGADADGGLGLGGAIAGGQAVLFGFVDSSTLNLTDDNLGYNLAQGGKGGTGGNGGDGNGGALAVVTGSATVTNDSVEHNFAIAGKKGYGGSDGMGVGGGVYVYSGGTFSADLATAIKKNHATTSDDNIYS